MRCDVRLTFARRMTLDDGMMLDPSGWSTNVEDYGDNCNWCTVTAVGSSALPVPKLISYNMLMIIIYNIIIKHTFVCVIVRHTTDDRSGSRQAKGRIIVLFSYRLSPCT